jgi:hypothetical protein
MRDECDPGRRANTAVSPDRIRLSSKLASFRKNTGPAFRRFDVRSPLLPSWITKSWTMRGF